MSSSCLGHDSHETQGTRPWTQRKNHVVWLGSKSLWELRISDDQNRKKKLNVWGATGNSRLKDLKDWVGNQDRVKTCFQMSKIVTRTSIGWIHSTHTYLPSTILRDCASPPMGNRFNPATPSNNTHNFLWGFSKWWTRNSCALLHLPHCERFLYTILDLYQTSTQFPPNLHLSVQACHPHKLLQLGNLSVLLAPLVTLQQWASWNSIFEPQQKRWTKKNRLVNWDRTYQETGLKIRIN